MAASRKAETSIPNIWDHPFDGTRLIFMYVVMTDYNDNISIYST